MNVLVITGDRSFGPGHPRYDLQRSAVDRLEVVHVGPGHLLPRIPRGPFDVVTAQDPFYRGHLAAHLAWWYRAKLNIQVHTDLSAHSWLRRRWASFNLRKADSVRVVSNALREQVLALGVRAFIFILPVFVDIERFKTLQAKPHRQKMILWMGRFEPEKGPLAALSVLVEAQKAGVDTRLVMIGDGSLRAQILKKVAELNLGIFVDLPGWQSDTTLFLEVADVVLCTSKHESWGASIVEALAAGVQVVAPDVGIAKEAGAIVALRPELGAVVVDVLKSGKRGALQIHVLNSSEWLLQWKNTLQ